MTITAKLICLNHTDMVQRVVDEAEYVLTILRRVRSEASANPELYDSDAQRRIDEAIARIEDWLRDAQLKVCEEKDLTAA